MEGIGKIYPNGVVANKNVNFSINKGEIHALAGENGAGKSTLMKILFGIEKPTEGKIFYKGEETAVKNPLGAIELGFGMVHQHFMLVESLTVAENITLGSEPTKWLNLDKKEMVKRADEIIKKYRFSINPMMKIRDLPIGTRQKVEILKALYKGAELLILDEPTAVLTPQETEELFVALKGLREMGHTIVFISHKLNEIKELCDRITIMRNGTTVGVYDVSSVSQEDISNLMVGRNMDWSIAKEKAKVGPIALRVKNLTIFDDLQRKLVDDVSFVLHSGTILGIVGIEGSGQNDTVEAITGLKKPDKGSVELFEEDIKDKSIREIREAGLSHIPQDRMEEGVVASSSISDNLFAGFSYDKRFQKKGVLNSKTIKKWSEEVVKEFGVKAKNAQVAVKMLSGGNVQKVVVAREYLSNPKLMVANQPTRGIDIGAAKFIHKKLIELSDQGGAILLVSADLAEVLEVSDSILVFCEGHISAYFPEASSVQENELGKYMLGLERMSKEEIEKAAL